MFLYQQDVFPQELFGFSLKNGVRYAKSITEMGLNTINSTLIVNILLSLQDTYMIFGMSLDMFVRLVWSKFHVCIIKSLWVIEIWTTIMLSWKQPKMGNFEKCYFLRRPSSKDLIFGCSGLPRSWGFQKCKNCPWRTTLRLDSILAGCAWNLLYLLGPI